MIDLLISQVFLIFWLLIFYGLIYLFNRFIPKGFIISQILFIYIWGLLRYFDVIYLGYLPYEDIPIYWIITAIIFIFINGKSKSIK